MVIARLVGQIGKCTPTIVENTCLLGKGRLNGISTSPNCGGPANNRRRIKPDPTLYEELVALGLGPYFASIGVT
ncbi:MAG: hypothetical protein ACKPB3_00265, partial [Bacteroidota bacterium]